ncbi:MAG: CoF synthetase [Paenibacillaceae bacterium]|nr:CoF synthetase [Paenibacillaceae bacterium]
MEETGITAPTGETIRAKLEEVLALHPWYRELTTSGADWHELPLLTHDKLMPYYERSVTMAGEGLYVYRTSGTSGGMRKAIVYDDADEAAYLAAKTELFTRLLQPYPARRALSDMGTGHAAATAIAVFEQLGLLTASIPFHEPVERHLAAIADFRPDVLYTMPSLLDSMLAAAGDSFDWGVMCVMLVGEAAPPAWRRQAAARLGIGADAVIDTYGSIEIGTIAYRDAATDRYVLLDGLFAEGATPAEAGLPGMELPAGESVLVLTSFVRRQFPALRFVTYDVVRDLRAMTIDGRERMTFAALVKRIGPELKHGEKISVYDIEHVVHTFAPPGTEVRVAVEHNRMRVYLLSETTIDEETITRIQDGVGDAIPAIGDMIRAGLLASIDVRQVDADNEAHYRGLAGTAAVKRKKLYVTGQ